MPRQPSSRLIALLWGLNILGLLAVLAMIIFYIDRQPVQAAVVLHPSSSVPPGVNPIFISQQTPLHPPTITRNPQATPIEGITPTPFLLPSGRRATIIGLSFSGRPIEVYTFGQGERQRMIVAGIHGGYEWNTIALADELITHINDNPELIPDDVTLYILRSLNPDGDARDHGYDGRVNDHGVDLNRNFPTNWSSEWDREGCWDYGPTTGGTGPASEPETRALVSFLLSHKIEALISYHSAALGVFPGGEPWEKNSIKFAKALANVTDYSFPPLDTGCVFTGTLADYAVERGAVAVDMELSTHVYTDFKRNLKALKVLLDWER